MGSAPAHTDTLTAVLVTPPGRGAVATWRILGSTEAVSRLPFETSQESLLEDQPVGRIWFGRWHGEEAVLIRTKESEWELSIHGGHAAVNRVRRDLLHLGGTLDEWEELLRKRDTELEAEFLIAATRAVTWTATEFLLRHPTREWINELQKWQHIFSGLPSVGEREQFIFRCEEWLKWSAFGRHLTVPYRVALVGEPNVGKSSLLNRLAGFERAIVQDRPGTTRDLVAVDTSFSGFPFRLTDTAGLRDTADELESEGIRRTHQFLNEVDLVLHLVECSTAPKGEEQQLSLRFPRALTIAHKSDLPLHPERAAMSGLLRVSSLTGEGIDQLVSEMVARLIPEVPGRQTIFPVTERQSNVLQFLFDQGHTAEPEILCRKIAELLFHPAQD